jgi:diguanylate cyclase (GGDEF)-like protein
MAFDTLLQDFDKEDAASEKSSLSRSAIITHNVNPVQHSENVKKAGKLGLPPSFATPAAGPVNNEDMHGLIEEFQNLTGAVRKHMMKPDFAKVAHDDHPTLTKIEKALTGFSEGRFSDVMGTVGSMAVTPFRMIPEGFRAIGAAAGTLSAGGGVDKALQSGVESLSQDETGYKPHTPAGKKVEEKVGKVFNFLFTDIPEFLTEGAINTQDYPAIAAMSTTALQMIPFATTGAELVARSHMGRAKIQNVVDTVKESKLPSRSPEDFKAFAKDAAKDTPPVVMPADKFDAMLASKGLKPEDVLEDPTHYYEAKSQGKGIEIPASDIAGMAEHIDPANIQDMTLDRRQDTATRKSLSDMSPEELKAELMTSHVSGIPNRRAYETGERQPFTAAIDADSLKWINDNMGHNTGNKLLKTIGQAIKSETDKGYHFSGDEFVIEGASKEEVSAIMDRVQERLKGEELSFTAPDGTKYNKKGIDITYGISESLVGADELLRSNKKAREATGERVGRGEPAKGVTIEKPAESIRPAVKTDEGIKTGADGERHTDIVKDAPEAQRGFLTPDGKFIKRPAASKWLEKNRPDLFDKLPEDQKAKLHSEGLWATQGVATPGSSPQQVTLLHAGINPLDGVKAAMQIAGEIRDTKTGKAVEKLMTPGLDSAHGIVKGIQSLVLPTAKSPEHLAAGELLGAKLGKMHRNQESIAADLRAESLTFEKMGVRNGKIDLTQNPGVKFMSDMSQGRMMEPKLERIAKKLRAQEEDMLNQLEAADAPLSQVRENYFPGMWTNESRKAFNQAIGGAIERGTGEGKPLAEWSAEDKAYVWERTKDLLAGGKGSEKDGLQYLTRTPFKGKESFRKGKVFDDIMTAVEFGLEPISNNPVDLWKLKMGEMGRSIMANDALKDWRASGDEKFLRVGEQVPEGWKKVDDKYGTVYGPRDMAGEDVYIGQPILGHRIVKEPVADVLNNYLSSSMYNNKYFGTLYKGYMGAANALNQSQLGVGSFFHVGFTESEVVISGGANLLKDVYGVLNGTRTISQATKTAVRMPQEFVRTPIEGDAILKEWRNPGSSMNPKIQQVAKAAELAGGGFKMEQGLRTEQTGKLIQDWYSEHRVRAAMRSPIAAIELMAKPIMDYLVPRQKAGVFGHLAERIIEQNPGKSLEQLTPEFRQAWNRVDARLGQVRYDRLFMNNSAKNAVQGLIRAPGWSGGTIAEIGGSLKDSAKFMKEWQETGKLPAELPDRIAYTMSLMVTVTAVNGMLTYAFTGDKPNGTDWWAFRTGGTDEYGRPERFVLPTYQKDIYAYMQDPGKTLLAKTHPIISIMGDVIKNKDYYGVTIANEDDSQIGKAIERGTYVLKQFEPFWMRGAGKEAERGGGVMQTLKDSPQKLLAPQIGIMPATSEYTKTTAEKTLTKYIGQQIPEGGRTQEAADISKARRELVRAIRNGGSIDDLPEKLQEKADKMTDRQIKNIEKEAELTPLQASFTHLTDPTVEKSIKVWAKMTDDERDQVRDIYETRINKFILAQDLDGDELDKLNQRIDKAEERK